MKIKVRWPDVIACILTCITVVGVIAAIFYSIPA